MADTLTLAGRLRQIADLGAVGAAFALPTDEERGALLAGADALDRLAQTCGTCQHHDKQHAREGWCYCNPPVMSLLRSYPFGGFAVPLDERCKGWTKREDA